ncbi:MAG: ABC transporter substrate-binding protein [Bifidobacterium sp.]|nr:ABC transporter substrate-binding protein [Bifidobacterium sp.]
MKKTKAVLASVAAVSMLASVAACGGSSSASGSSDGTITLKVQTFNNPGFGAPTSERPGADLWAKYEAANPGVKIEETAAASSDDARAAFNTAISSGSNAYDVYLTEVDWMPSIMAMPDKFVDLTDYTKDNDWVSWKTESASVNGKLIGAGTDIGPEGICYRADLMEQAGLPSDPAGFAEYVGGENATWESYFKAGAEYTKKTGKPWYDSMASNWQSMINQVEESYISKNDEVIATSNKTLKDMYDQLTATKDQSAHLAQWSDDWNAAFKADDGFATIQCPAWLLNNIKGNTGEDFTGRQARRVADRPGPADRGLQDRQQLPVLRERAGLRGRVLQDRRLPGRLRDRQGLRQPRQGVRRGPLQGRPVLRHPDQDVRRPQPRGRHPGADGRRVLEPVDQRRQGPDLTRPA